MASVSPVSIFSEARERVREEIDSLVECLGNKKDRMVEEIDSLEKEFVDKQRERQKDITKLNTLIAQTEELGQNTLLSVQQKVKLELHQEIGKLKQQALQPEYTVTIQWGFDKDILINHINNTTIGKISDISPLKIESQIDEISSSPLPDVFWDQNTEVQQFPLTESTDTKLDSVSCEEKSPVSSSLGGSPVVNVHLLPDDISTETVEYSLIDEIADTNTGDEFGRDTLRRPSEPRRESNSHRGSSSGQHSRYFDYAPRGAHQHYRGHRREHNPYPRGHRKEHSHPRGGNRRDMDRDYNKYR